MKRIELNEEEIKKYETIKQLVDLKGNKKRIAIELGITERQVNRLINGYKECGKEFFIHGNKGRKPENALDEKTKELIKDLYNSKYYGANLEHYSELLEKHEGVKVSSNTIRTIFKEEYMLSPKARRETKRNVKKELEKLKEKATTKKESDIIQKKNN
jgi:transposase